MNTYVFEAGTKKKIFYAFLAGLFFLAVGIGLSASGSGHKEAPAHGAHTEAAAQHAEAPAADAQHHAEAPAHGEAAAGHHAEEVSTGTKVLANFYSMFLFGFFVAVAAIFFLAASTIAWGGWQIQIQKIPLAISRTVYLFLALLFICFALFGHSLFEWMHEDLYNPESPMFDKLLMMKHDYLNPTRFYTFYVILALASGGLAYAWWKNLTAQDERPSLQLFSKSRSIAALSIVLIAFVIDTFATWDWSMSLQPHWYSTMYPWYTMASAAVTMFSIVMLIILHLKDKGLLPNVNENHLHDVAKLMFAISVFWMYVYFDQYMLIWYGNIPEETIYFINRRQADNYGILFHLTIILNFLFPFLILLKRGAKRNPTVTKVMAVIIIIGHWMDFYLMVGPALIPKGGFGFISLGALLTVGSVFTYLTLWALSSVKDLTSSTHPYLKESYQHQI